MRHRSAIVAILAALAVPATAAQAARPPIPRPLLHKIVLRAERTYWRRYPVRIRVYSCHVRHCTVDLTAIFTTIEREDGTSSPGPTATVVLCDRVGSRRTVKRTFGAC